MHDAVPLTPVHPALLCYYFCNFGQTRISEHQQASRSSRFWVGSNGTTLRNKYIENIALAIIDTVSKA